MPESQYAVIDLETTGGSARSDKITEVAILLHDGERVTQRYSRLVNPERPIPGYISQITGITDDMVADAPRFFEIAREVVELTQGRIFVAHNASFDYGFLRAEFDSLGYDFTREVLCTVRMSRRVFPGFPSYSLGKLCERLEIPLYDRHRALGDAEATAILLSRILAEQGAARMAARMKRPGMGALPPGISQASWEQLPAHPGIWYVHDAQGQMRYCGHGRDCRAEAGRWLAKVSAGQVRGLPPEVVTSLSGEACGGVLLAELRQVQTCLALQPSANSVPTPRKAAWGIYSYPDQSGAERPYLARNKSGQAPLRTFTREADGKALLQTLEQQPATLPLPQWVHCADLPAPRFLIAEPGRTQGESSIIAIEYGVCTGYAWLDTDLLNHLEDGPPVLLQAFPAHPAFMDIIRRYLEFAPRSRILPW